MIDLHIHTTGSDGSCTPSEVIELAMKRKLKAISITDHDSLSAFHKIDINKYKEFIEIVPGIELSTNTLNRVHILGYYVGLESRLSEKLEELKAINLRIYIDQLKAHNNPNVAMLYKRMSPKECIELINASGGVSVLAHPIRYNLSIQELQAFVDELKGYGLDGIECLHSEQDLTMQRIYQEIAMKNNLLISGGSDFHGETKIGVELGKVRSEMNIDYDYLLRIKERHLNKIR